MSYSGKTLVYGIIGHPVTHSFSPAMQNAAFAETGLDAVYIPFPVTPDNVAEALKGLLALGISGVNVTVPHKTAVIPFLDEITDTAKKIGAVNTIRNDNGHLIGTNTDASGFLRSLKDLSFSPKNSTIALLGAGGATRAILVALAESGAKTIWICNRTKQKAQQLVDSFAPLFPNTKILIISLEELQATPLDLLVNTTTVGMPALPSFPVDLHKCSEIKNIVDIIYTPAQTPLLEQAQKLKIPYLNGMGMLLYQGGDAFEFWTQKTAPISVMEQHLTAFLQQQLSH